MEQLNLNLLLNRKECAEKLIESLNIFEINKQKLLTKRGIYVYGSPGAGKTQFVKNTLKKLNYDIIMYDAGDVRNKTVIDTITKQNMSDKNVLSMFNKKIKKIAIVMDEIDGMNNGDKGGINSLIKLIRPKKTNKQKKEDTTMIPIICIGNYHMDKKIREMMKICTTIELKSPTNTQINNILNILIPNVDNELLVNIVNYIQGDLRKLKSTYDIYKNHEQILKNHLIHKIFQKKNYNENTKDITWQLLSNSYTLNNHHFIMNETDRTSVGLLFHENIIDYLDKDKYENIKNYIDILDNFVFSDYIDRITFQKQIWIFNEMTSLIKTMYNNMLFHKNISKKIEKKDEVRFTKVLTKYSTEYNNTIFIQNLSNKLVMDKKDLFSFFIHLRKTKDVEEIYSFLSNENYDISKLDISRLYRYIDKCNEIYVFV
tara:strand:+ start:2843 stop:4129 length:1287 start_codon:yes stop_codon:yes gene_type:complete